MNARLLIALTLVLGLCSAALAADSACLFSGKNLDGWKLKGPEKSSQWKVGTAALDPANPAKIQFTPGEGEMVNAGAHGLDIYTEKKFGDGTIHVELMVPKGSNSGVYVMGEYEIQVLDSYGKEKIGPGDMGGIYAAKPAKVNASKKPGEWQEMIIEYKAPRFEDGKKTANARIVKITLNGQVIHEDVELKGATPGGVTGKEAAEGPLMFQGNHGEVAYRNISFTPAK